MRKDSAEKNRKKRKEKHTSSDTIAIAAIVCGGIKRKRKHIQIKQKSKYIETKEKERVKEKNPKKKNERKTTTK